MQKIDISKRSVAYLTLVIFEEKVPSLYLYIQSIFELTPSIEGTRVSSMIPSSVGPYR